jgi:hypothetical protein
MALRPPLPAPARRILDLARADRAAAREELAKLPLASQVELVCETTPERRSELLDLCADPGPLIRELPEAELCFTVKAIGLADAGWVLEHATEDQIRACVDLDAWPDDVPDREAVGRWIAAFSEAGDECLERSAKALDPELLVGWIRDRAEVVLKESEEGWEPPPGSRSVDGQFHLSARREGDDLADLLRLLDLLFRHDYWFYFRMLQGAIWELPSELEEGALHWRAGRLQDLGFPPREQAMRVYGFLPPDERTRLPVGDRPRPLGEWRLPVWMPRLPTARDASEAVFAAAAELSPEERRSFFYSFVALANQVALADRLPLGDAASIPTAIAKAARLASAGLELVAREQQLTPVEVLRVLSLERLFRVGANLDREGGRP